jgi:hypothetical protein
MVVGTFFYLVAQLTKCENPLKDELEHGDGLRIRCHRLCDRTLFCSIDFLQQTLLGNLASDQRPSSRTNSAIDRAWMEGSLTKIN